MGRIIFFNDMKTNYAITAAAIRRNTNRLGQYVGSKGFALVNARINRLHRLFAKQIHASKGGAA